MPNRILREGILDSDPVDALTYAEEVFYRRLMSAVDDFGRFDANPKLLRAKCYALRLDSVSDGDIDLWLAACARVGLVYVYRAVNGKRYLEIRNFRQQTRAVKSKCPGPAIDENYPVAPSREHSQSTCDADATHTCGVPYASAAELRSDGRGGAPKAHSDGAANAAHMPADSIASENHPTDDCGTSRQHTPAISNPSAEQAKDKREALAHVYVDGDEFGGEASSSAKRRGSRLTLNALPADWEQWARSARPDLDPLHVWEKFRDYWIAQSGQKGVKSDWLATWRNWVRDERPGTRPQITPGTTCSTGNAARKLS